MQLCWEISLEGRLRRAESMNAFLVNLPDSSLRARCRQSSKWACSVGVGMKVRGWGLVSDRVTSVGQQNEMKLHQASHFLMKFDIDNEAAVVFGFLAEGSSSSPSVIVRLRDASKNANRRYGHTYNALKWVLAHRSNRARP